MKKILLLLCYVFLTNMMHSQDVYEKVFYSQEYNYYGLPQFYHGGFGYQKDDFRMTIPYVGSSFDPINGYGVDLYSGITFHYRDFTFDARFVHQLGTWQDRHGLGYLEALNKYGRFSLNYNFLTSKVSFTFDVGEYNITNKNTASELVGSRELVLKSDLSISGIAYDNQVTRIGYESSFVFHVVPSLDTSTFHFSTYIPMNFHIASGWLSFNMMPGVEYKEFIERGSSSYQFTSPTRVYRSLLFFKNDPLNYQMLTTFSTELRFYMKFLEGVSPALSRLFLNIIATVGYASTFEQATDNGSFIYLYGGGIGYYLFDSAAFILNVGSDNRKEMFFNLSIVSPLELSI